MRRAALLLAALLAAAPAALSGCDQGRDRLKAVSTLAGAPAGGRSAAASALAKLLADGKVTAEQALNLAFDRLDSLPASAGKESLEATAFAGAVLDAIAARQAQMLTGPEYELFWARVGGLAFRAAEEANASGRVPEAATLATAGGDRWQNDAYWDRRPDHDALVAMILANLGRRDEALARLRSRPDLKPPADTMLRSLEALR